MTRITYVQSSVQKVLQQHKVCQQERLSRDARDDRAW